ncbi:hypothetical protein ACJRO7_021346 [Eucalyptus globulus]|uniref:Uncharacterized protein n=1 Tax=Eucalyptus globulus TaxID=34317 RepID=A0ABD3KKA0_EUCGL
MAASKHFVALLILAFLSASISVEEIDVKERESFSKFTNANNDNDDKGNTRVFPNKKEALTTAETLKKQENKGQQSTFHPQTQHGYGLYRHEEEMVKNTPATANSTSTGNRPSKTTRPDDSFYSYQNGNFENSNRYYNDRSYDRRSNNYHHHNDRSNDRRSNDYHHQREQARDTYMPEEQNFGGNTRLQDSSYTTTTTTATTKKTSSSASSRGTTVGNNYNTGGIQIGFFKWICYQNGNFENSNRYYNDRSYDRRSNNYHHHNDRSNDRRSNDYHHQREQARDTYMPEEQDFGGNTRLQDSSYTTTTTTATTKKTSSSASFRGTTVGNNYNTGGIQIGFFKWIW